MRKLRYTHWNWHKNHRYSGTYSIQSIALDVLDRGTHVLLIITKNLPFSLETAFPSYSLSISKSHLFNFQNIRICSEYDCFLQPPQPPSWASGLEYHNSVIRVSLITLSLPQSRLNTAARIILSSHSSDCILSCAYCPPLAVHFTQNKSHNYFSDLLDLALPSPLSSSPNRHLHLISDLLQHARPAPNSVPASAFLFAPFLVQIFPWMSP